MNLETLLKTQERLTARGGKPPYVLVMTQAHFIELERYRSGVIKCLSDLTQAKFDLTKNREYKGKISDTHVFV